MSEDSAVRAGRMECYARMLVELADEADGLTDEDLRSRLRFYAELARKRLELPSGRPA